MQKDEKTHSKFHRDQVNESWFKIVGTNFGSPVHGWRRGVKFWIFLKIPESIYREAREEDAYQVQS